jgi:hypothetical protein
MEISLESIISLVGLLSGGGAIGGLLSWKYARKKAKAEALQAEAEAEKAKVETSQATAEMMKTIQDGYQQMISDMKANLDEQKQYSEEQNIAEIKEDRVHLRKERDELRKRQDDLEETVRNLQFRVARNCRMVEFMRPFLCGREGCAIRVPVVMPGEEGNKKEAKDIEPLDMKVL